MNCVLRLALLVLIASAQSTLAQGWSPWDPNSFGRRTYDYDRPWSPPTRSYRPPAPREPQLQAPAQGSAQGGDIRDGGARPQIEAEAPSIVPFTHNYPSDSIVIDTGGRMLYYVLPGRRAYQYRISVGREGFSWTGTETVSRKQAWPDWHPPAEMRERDPSLPVKMTGGLKNPLGAMALYLGQTLYRIHGTNDPKSIGRASSSGCFRMMNENVQHLASMTKIGAPVTVVKSLPRTYEVGSITPPVKPSEARGVYREATPRPPVYFDPDDDEPPPVWRRAPPRGYWRDYGYGR